MTYSARPPLIERLYANNFLDDYHLDAAREITTTIHSFERSLFASRNPYQPRIDQRPHISSWHFRAFSPGTLDIYHHHYRPWAEMMGVISARKLADLSTRPDDKNALEFMWDFLTEKPVTELTKKYRLKVRGQRYWKPVVKNSLHIYAEIARWIVRDAA